jgi:hypothetical protein
MGNVELRDEDILRKSAEIREISKEKGLSRS